MLPAVLTAVWTEPWSGTETISAVGRTTIAASVIPLTPATRTRVSPTWVTGSLESIIASPRAMTKSTTSRTGGGGVAARGAAGLGVLAVEDPPWAQPAGLGVLADGPTLGPTRRFEGFGGGRLRP